MRKNLDGQSFSIIINVMRYIAVDCLRVEPSNSRLSAISTTSTEDEATNVDQLVVAQVHHDPIREEEEQGKESMGKENTVAGQ